MHDDFHFPTTQLIPSNPDAIRIESTTAVELSVEIDEIRSVLVRSSTSPRCVSISPSQFPTISIFPSTSVPPADLPVGCEGWTANIT